MTLWQSFLIALDMLALHKLRAFLTMFGVIVGVMSVTLIVMLSQGMRAYITREFERIGSDTIFLQYDPFKLAEGETVRGIEGLSEDLKRYVLDRVPDVTLASAYREAGSYAVRAGEREVKNVRTMAVDEHFLELYRFELVEGRFIDRSDIERAANVALVNEETARRLFPDGRRLGRLVELPGITLEIVGVTKDLEMLGGRTTEVLVMPLSTANRKWLGGERVDLILLRGRDGVPLDRTMQRVWEALMAKTGNRAVFTVESSANVLRVFQNVIGVVGAILAAIAALSLLVGGIGIMNIMLVSVTERTREIGLRKAVGAKRPVILGQFLVESATLSLVGGLVGMAIAYGLGQVVTLLTQSVRWPNAQGLPAVFPLVAALFAVAFSAVIGIVFGLYPALRAARLDPIEALRHE